MITKISNEAAGASSDGTVVEKVVTIDNKNSKLDAIASQTPAATVENQVEQKPAETAPVETSTEAKPVETKVETPVNTTPEVKAQENKEPEFNPETFLDEFTLDVGGEERTLNQLLDERDQLAQRVAEIEGDEFLKGFIQHYLATGNANAYLEAKGVDWDKKSSLDIVKIQFDRDHADLNEKVKELLWKKTLSEKYNIRPDLTQEEMESEGYLIGQGLLERDANKARNEFKETQKKFQIAERKQPEQPKPFDHAEYKKQLLQDKEVQSFLKNKLLKIGVGDEAGNTFGYEPTNTEQIIDMMSNDKLFWQTLVKDGKVDRMKQARVYAFSADPDAYDKELIEFGKTLAEEERLKVAKNTDGRLDRQEQPHIQETSRSKGILNKMLQQKQS